MVVGEVAGVLMGTRQGLAGVQPKRHDYAYDAGVGAAYVVAPAPACSLSRHQGHNAIDG